MPRSKRILAILGCLALATSGLLAQAPKSDAKDKDAAPNVAAPNTKPEVGQIIPDHTFKTILNGDGRLSMKELRGSVVLIDWWGYH